MWPAFPASDYYEDSAPQPRRTLTMCASPYLLRDNSVAVPTFTDLRRRGRCPAIPLQPRRASLAVYARPRPSHRTAALDERMSDRLSPTQHCASPYPPGWSWLTNRGASDTGSLSVVAPSRLACATAVSGSATAPLRCQGCSRSRVHLHGRPTLSFSRPLHRSREEPLTPRGISAPRGAQPISSMTSSL